MSKSTITLEEVIKQLPEKVTLTYVDYRDELNSEDCAKILGGQLDDVALDIDENNDRSYGYDSVLEDIIPDAEEREAFKDSDDYPDFMCACDERDDSNVIRELAKNSGNKMVRFRINLPDGNQFYQDGWVHTWEEKQIIQTAKDMAKALRVQYKKNADKLVEIVENASYGGYLYVLAYVDFEDLMDAVDHCLQKDSHKVRITFTNPNVLILDRLNGSGHENEIEGKVTIEFSKKDLDTNSGAMQLDEKGAKTGYSWSDDIAGVVKSCYETDIKIEKLP